ncbi:MAG: RHS repeat-associated core domain-containing protein [Terracidiphilus sp.]
MPYGDALPPAPIGNCYVDATEHHFTGKERDSESGNDDFGARYYSSAMARFLSPDPFLDSGRPDDPQTWNRYAYALNNPLIVTDPTGLYNLVNTCHADQPDCMKDFAKYAKNLKDGLEALNTALDDPMIAKSLGLNAVVRLSQGLAAMGGENDGNNVDVKFGTTDSGGASDTTKQIDVKTGSSRFTVTLDPTMTKGSEGFAINADHEGMHAYDEKNNQLTAANHPFQFEYRGYQNSSWAAQALGWPSSGARNTQIWNKSWSAVDRETLRDKGITKVVTDRLHPVEEPHNPITP